MRHLPKWHLPLLLGVAWHVRSSFGCTVDDTCPFTGLDGRLRGATRLKGIESFRASANGLVPLALQAWGGLLFVAHAPQHASLADWLGEGGAALAPRLAATVGHRHVGSREYTLRCNWKVFCDNYLVSRRTF